MKVAEIMSTPVVTVRAGETLEAVARLMLERNIGCVPAVDDAGRLVGLITERNFMAREVFLPFTRFALPKVLGEWMPNENIETIYQAARSRTAGEIMSPNPITATEDQFVAEVVRLMLAHDVHRVPIVRDGVPVGVVSRHDLLRLMV